MARPETETTGQPRPETGSTVLPPGRRLLHRAAAAAEPLPPLLLEADRVAETVRQGLHGRRRAGAGETFWQFRDFQHHDSSLHIDWRQSAKSDRLFVRDAEWEAAQTAYLWADRSASMVFRSSRNLTTKRTRAMLLLLALGSLLTRSDERVALLSRIDSTRPASGRAGLINLANALVPGDDEAEPDRSPDNPYGNLPPIQPLPRHSQTIWFGDFLSPLEDIAAAIAPLVNGGIRGHLVQVLDPAEESLPYQGRTRFRDLENDDRLLVPRVESIREIYAEKLESHRQGLAALTRNAGWTLTHHRTDQTPEHTLLTLFGNLSARREALR
jgi:uncharacterized protein (DUF58 family)